MLKRTVVLLAPLAVVAALVMMPVSAHANFICSGGTPTNPSPICEYVCKVPRVVGKSLKKAEALLRAHNCRTGPIVRPRHHKRHKGKRTVVVAAQAPHAGGVYVENQKVGMRVKYKYHHKKKHKK